MSKLLVYPISKDSISILRHKEMIRCFDEITGATIKANWHQNEDFSYIDNGCKTGSVSEWDFEKALEFTDEVLFAKPDSEVDFNEFFLPRIQLCRTKNKSFEFSFALTKEQKKCLKEKGFSKPSEKCSCEYDVNKPLYTIDAPVIFICGLGEATDKFELQLLLRDRLQKDHYKVSQIGSKKYSELFGFHSIPDFMYEQKLSEKEKITKFNSFVKDIQVNEKPDIFLIGIPFGVERKNVNDFAILPYEISAAVLPDYVFLCTYFEKYYNEYLLELIQRINGRFDLEVNQLVISNTYKDNNSDHVIKNEILKVPVCMADQLADTLQASFDLIPVCSLYSGIDMIYQTMMSELIDNTAFTII